MQFRRYREGDAPVLSALMRRSLLEINTDSPQWEIDWLYARYSPEGVAEIAAESHMYVMLDGETIMGTGTVALSGPGEAELKAAFLAPEYVGRGLGVELFRTLEADEYAVGASRIWLTSSDQALNFYERLGYQYVYGYRGRNEDKLFEMEKRHG